jgi:hypothetical protein
MLVSREPWIRALAALKVSLKTTPGLIAEQGQTILDPS